ncbi:MAG TPA: tRNA (N6-isopentenyl adenosine(37)-C2)-methylthiotransferase MiaB [Candidatus Latescibacteria bacterium]|nr:tRNA (N6-isopentenyl adenosine(37)-C2)-methylthiotransferase MiaB [Candidatus Latescibacterota bacterium]
MRRKRVYIETYGCQMNKADSEIIKAVLSASGYSMTAVPERADVILLNTCSVREHAEQRVLGRISQLRQLKLENPGLILGVVGCMAQKMGKELIGEGSGVNLIAGPDSYRRLPGLLETSNNGSSIDLGLDPEEVYSGINPRREDKVKAWVPIMRGCDKFCSYCVVPYLRGRERSRPADEILEEVKALAEQGHKEVTLLGQNVNSYKDGATDFADLLRSIDETTCIQRVRFLTSHPKDMSQKVLHAINESKSLCEHIHLPLQSGSSRILARMNRGYNKEQYLQLIRLIREIIRGVSISTDIIVGFPGETEEDFQETLDVVKEVGFDSAFTYKYSPRKGTRAYEFEDDVPPEEKQERLERLICLQRKISASKNQSLVGSRQEVLIEGRNRKGTTLGRTRTDKPVALQNDSELTPGDIVEVEIIGSTSATLIGCATSPLNHP